MIVKEWYNLVVNLLVFQEKEIKLSIDVLEYKS